MKDIQREVKALEVAMQVATDIQDKPYAYAVARIQEALLGSTEVTEVHTGDGHWYIHFYGKCPGIAIVITTPSGGTHCYRLPVSASITMARRFVEDFSSRDPLVKRKWCVFMPEVGGVYLRNGVDELPLGAISQDSSSRSILVELQIYLKNLSQQSL